MQPMISIVIPMYNLQGYIIECLESIRMQSYRNFEVLIIDDGSTDQCGVMVKEYIAYHQLANFFLHVKTNGGISSARNYGLDRAKGEWLLFIDGDDWMEPECMEVLIDTLNQYPSDLVIGGVRTFDCTTGNTIETDDCKARGVGKPHLFNSFPYFDSCWGKLYRKSIVEKYQIRFDERIKYSEDIAWQFDYCRWIDGYSYSGKGIYNYRINRDGSITQKLITPDMKRYVCEHMFCFLNAYEAEIMNEAVAKNQMINRVMWNFISTAVVNDILDKKYREAKEIMKMDIANKLVKTFEPRTYKDMVFLKLWKKPFALFAAFVMLYYNNFAKLRRSKLVIALSKAKQ